MTSLIYGKPPKTLVSKKQLTSSQTYMNSELELELKPPEVMEDLILIDDKPVFPSKPITPDSSGQQKNITLMRKAKDPNGRFLGQIFQCY